MEFDTPNFVSSYKRGLTTVVVMSQINYHLYVQDVDKTAG